MNTAQVEEFLRRVVAVLNMRAATRDPFWAADLVNQDRLFAIRETLAQAARDVAENEFDAELKPHKGLMTLFKDGRPWRNRQWFKDRYFVEYGLQPPKNEVDAYMRGELDLENNPGRSPRPTAADRRAFDARHEGRCRAALKVSRELVDVLDAFNEEGNEAYADEQGLLDALGRIAGEARQAITLGGRFPSHPPQEAEENPDDDAEDDTEAAETIRPVQRWENLEDQNGELDAEIRVGVSNGRKVIKINLFDANNDSDGTDAFVEGEEFPPTEEGAREASLYLADKGFDVEVLKPIVRSGGA